MIANTSSVYAQILNGQVHLIFTYQQLPFWNDSDIHVVDVTNTQPQPQQGWSYNGTTFSVPAATVPAPLPPTLQQVINALIAKGVIQPTDV